MKSTIVILIVGRVYLADEPVPLTLSLYLRWGVDREEPQVAYFGSQLQQHSVFRNQPIDLCVAGEFEKLLIRRVTAARQDVCSGRTRKDLRDSIKTHQRSLALTRARAQVLIVEHMRQFRTAIHRSDQVDRIGFNHPREHFDGRIFKYQPVENYIGV